MFLFVGLSDDPGNEHLGLLARFRQQFEWDHVEHLYRLVELCVQFAEVVKSQGEESQH